MKISLFEEFPLPTPWVDTSEQTLFHNKLEQIGLADQLGYSTVWCTEHHFMEEYSHMSSPDVFLAAVSQRTSRIRLGFGIMHTLPGVNHPARVAERVSTLDLVSAGRVEFGTGEGSSVAELGGFVLDPGKKRAMWNEGVRVATRAMGETPFTGFEGEYVSMPSRNVIPKPIQKPHPPVWVACTRQSTVTMAASTGIGALSFAFISPEEFAPIVKEYYAAIGSAVPLGLAPNFNISATIGGLVCARSSDEAINRLSNRARFFGHGVQHYYLEGVTRPGRTQLWAEYEKRMTAGTARGSNVLDHMMVGSPSDIRRTLEAFEATGVDQVMFLTPPIEHDDVMESLELFGRKVLPDFLERDEVHVEQKAKRLGDLAEQAMDRRPADVPYDPDYTFGSMAVQWETGTPIPEMIEAEEKRRPVD
jgi:alkanesulfonate monooxygenase SsuD/methylene tetrahydromethanopterin reductase-like flavin-dependent oxidoreductase (luciferase family)